MRFLARPRGYRAFFTDEGAVFAPPRGGALRMRFDGARAGALEAGAPLPGRSHYFLGSDPARWVTGVPHLAELRGRDLYPGIDLRWRGLPGGRLEYDLVLAPGADPGLVALRFEGARSLDLDAAGGLLVAAGGGILRHAAPVAWQEAGGRRRAVPAAFVLGESGRVGFRVGAFDRDLPLVLDPVLEYSSFLGGTSNEVVNGLAIDGAGALYAAGATSSTSGFPLFSPIQGIEAGANDAFVTKFNATGSTILYSTYLGGSGNDQAYGLVVDGSGQATVCGGASSANFPLASPLYGTHGGGYDGFVARLGASGGTLVYSTYLPGSSQDYARGVALAPDGGVFVAGSTASTNFPASATAYQKTFGGSEDAFVLRLGAAGTTLGWSTFLGGVGSDGAWAVAVDSSGRPVIAGGTDSASFPILGGAQGVMSGGDDAFVTKVAADGTALVWSTFYGGNGAEIAFGVGVGPDDRVWATGTTSSTDLPAVGAWQSISGGGQDAFLVRLSAAGAAFQMSTYLGGGGDDTGYAVAVDGGGAAFVTGATPSAGFPTQAPIQGTKGALGDLFLAEFTASSSTPEFCTFLGGNGDDAGRAVAVDSKGKIAAGGSTSGTSNTFPLLNAYDSTLGGSGDAVLVVIRGVPYAPTGVGASLVDLTTVEILWTQPGTEETGFEVERSKEGAGFSGLASTPANTVSYLDANLEPATTYSYRVRTVVGNFKSEPSEEVSVTTPATPTYPPAAPTDLAAVVVSPRRVDLSWTDNSDNESFFILARALGSGLYATLATPRLGATAHSDATPLPGRTYTYRIRATNPTGPSLDSNTQVVTMPSTLEVALLKAVVVDRESAGKDSVKASGTLQYGEDAVNGSFDATVQAFSLRLSGLVGPALVDIPAADGGWSLRKGKWTWRSPRGSFTKAKVVVDAATGAWSVLIRRMTLPSAPANPQRVTLTAGTDEGHVDADWTPASARGVVKYPVPVPK